MRPTAAPIRAEERDEDMVHRLIGEVHKLAACAQRFPEWLLTRPWPPLPKGLVSANAPQGWQAKTVNKGELFREVKLNRGHAMQLASQEA
jgi:hypothetical protein